MRQGTAFISRRSAALPQPFEHVVIRYSLALRTRVLSYCAVESGGSLLRLKLGILTIPVVAVAQGPVSVVVLGIVTYEYCFVIRCSQMSSR